MSEEPDLKDFFPALKKPETEETASGQAEGNAMGEGSVKAETPAMAQEPQFKEPSAPLQPSDSLVPPPAATEVKKVEEAKATPPPAFLWTNSSQKEKPLNRPSP